MELKDAFKELARFAEARARGAAVVLGNGRRLDGTDGFTGLGVDANTFMSHTIKEIIEPKVLRDWTAEDAKKFEGYAFRMAGGDSMWIMRKSFAGLPGSWVGYEYAAPIPGTDPAKWDWKPCKVEVLAEKAKPAFDAISSLRQLVVGKTGCCGNTRSLLAGINAIIKNMEQAE